MLASMHSSVVLWLVLATGLFWGVGVYNRLMRMRAHGLDAFGSVEKLLRSLEALVQQHMDAATHGPVSATDTPDPPDALWPQWLALREHLQAVESACKAVRAEPLCPRPLAVLSELHTKIMQDWKALQEAPADLAGAAVPQELQAQWDESGLRLQMACQAFNQIVERYNAALHEFPARLIVGVLGFRKAGVL